MSKRGQPNTGGGLLTQVELAARLRSDADRDQRHRRVDVASKCRVVSYFTVTNMVESQKNYEVRTGCCSTLAKIVAY